jgi:hypothetical protein
VFVDVIAHVIATVNGNARVIVVDLALTKSSSGGESFT